MNRCKHCNKERDEHVVIHDRNKKILAGLHCVINRQVMLGYEFEEMENKTKSFGGFRVNPSRNMLELYDGSAICALRKDLLEDLKSAIVFALDMEDVQ